MREGREMKTLKKVIDGLKNYFTLTIEEDEYCKHDLKDNNKHITIEVKQRDLSLSELFKYGDEGFILQEDKYNHLKDNRGYYVNLFNINNIEFMLIWNVKKIIPKIEDKLCRITTTFNNLEYRHKKVILLTFFSAHKYLININNNWLPIGPMELIQKIYGA